MRCSAVPATLSKLIRRLVSAGLAAGLAIAGPALATAPAATKPGASKPASQVDWCARLSPRLPGVSTEACRQAGLAPAGAASQLGFPILKRQIFPAKVSADRHGPVRVLLLGGIHGDELTAAAIVFRWMQWTQTSPAQQFQWNIVPVVNPDGLLAPKPTRVNANGVDLNRNFPTPGWTRDAPRYWVKTTGSDPRRFPGKSPLSEPESRWINDEIARFNPHVIISVHAPFGVLDFDGPARPPRKFGRLVFTPVGVYPGSLGNYSGLHKKVPIITIELPNALQMPPEAEVKRIWLDMLSWIQRNVRAQKEAGVLVQRTAAKPGPVKN
ncbi:MAG: succinylglutamate desuccinylase/aspartoacylase family protein [Burkholderiales bacterium]|nr:succinylglutamate desuccinylase/aspartoacylase family protein [Burkholderiales bacterium]